MITIEHASDLAEHVGSELGVSAWRRIDIDDFVAFGKITGDAHWTHTDRDRARRETSLGDVTAQGFLTLSLITALSEECLAIRRATRWLNYGLDRVRFTHAVLPGDHVRLRMGLASCVSRESGGSRIALRCTIEIEGNEKPALIADWIALVE